MGADLGLGHEGLGQAQLPGGQGLLGPRPVRGCDEAQGLAAVFLQDLQALPPVPGLATADAVQPTFASLHNRLGPVDAQGQDAVRQDQLQGLGGGDSQILVDIQEFNAIDDHAPVEPGLRQAVRRGQGAAQDGFHGVAHPHAAVPGTHQQAGYRR